MIQLAGRTLVVSLPSDWAQKYGVSKGSSLNLDIDGSKIIINPTSKNYKSSQKIAEIDVSNVEERVVRWLLSCLHKKGYDEIHVNFNDPAVLSIINELIKDLFVGFTIVSQTERRCIIKSISMDIDSDFEAVMRRAFQVSLQMGEQVLLCLRQGNMSQLIGLISMEHMNNQLTNFCERLLNKGGYKEYENTCFMYVIVWNLEKVCDNYKYICSFLSVQENYPAKIRPELLDFFEETNKLFRQYYELFYKFDILGLNSLSNRKSDLENMFRNLLVNASTSEAVIISYLMDIVNHIMDFSASTFAVNYFTYSTSINITKN